MKPVLLVVVAQGLEYATITFRTDQGGWASVFWGWTVVLNPVYTLPAPLIGTVVGLLAGAYPALRAARTSPLAALRHA